MGEITAPSPYSFNQDSQLTIADVAVDDSSNPMVLRIRLKRTKTQQFKAVDIYLGRTNDDLCPVAALLAYIAVRGMSAGPLFFFQDGQYLTKESFISWVRSALDTLGINSAEYAGHSFRIGAATTAAEQGIEDSVIKMLGRWESSAYQIYIQTPRELGALSSNVEEISSTTNSEVECPPSAYYLCCVLCYDMTNYIFINMVLKINDHW